MSEPATHRLPLRLRTSGLRYALFRAFDDGEWHILAEVVEVARGLISPEQALRSSEAAHHAPPSVDRGLLRLARSALEKKRWVEIEWRVRPSGRGGPPVREAFRIVPGQHFDPPPMRLSEQDVVDIKVRLSAGDSLRSISRDYGISRQAVANISRGVTHAGVAYVPVERTEDGPDRPTHVRVRNSPAGFARAVLKHLPSRGDRRQVIDLLRGKRRG